MSSPNALAAKRAELALLMARHRDAAPGADRDRIFAEGAALKKLLDEHPDTVYDEYTGHCAKVVRRCPHCLIPFGVTDDDIQNPCQRCYRTQ